MSDSYKEKNKALITGTIIYTIGNLGTKLLSFIIVPLYTYYINTADMGDYDLVNSTISLLTPLLTLQIMDAAYAFMMRRESSISNCIDAVYKFMFVTSVLSIAVILLINSFVTIKYCLYMILLLTISRFFAALQKLLRGLKNQKLFTISGIAYTAIFLILNLIQIVVLKQGVDALFQSAIISYTICTVFVLICEKRLRVFNFKFTDFQLQKKMLKFSVPLVPNQLNWWLINSLDRYIIRYFLGSSANGIYAIAYKFPSVLQLLFNIFYMSWQDMAIVDKNEDSGIYYTKIFKMYYKFSFTFLICLIPFTKLFILFAMDESYHSATQYVGFLYLGTLFQAFSSFFGVGYLKNDKTKQAATTSIWGAVVNTIVNLALVKVIGLYASAVATFIGFLIMFIMRLFHTKQSLNVKINAAEFSLLFLIDIAVIIINIFTNTTQDIIIFAAGVLIFLVTNGKELITISKKMLNKIKGKHIYDKK